MSQDQCAGQNNNIKVGIKSFEMVEYLRYFGTNITSKNYIHEESRSRLKLANACYHLVQNILSSNLLFQNIGIKTYRTMILPVVWYGCEDWSLTLREECKLRLSENRVLRKIFGPKRNEVTGEWRRLHNEEPYNLNSSTNILVFKSRRMRWAGHVTHTGERRGAYRGLVRKPEEKKPLVYMGE
jgi:hypothetical protein